MTEAQLASAVNINVEELRLYESGEARIPSGVLLSIADVLGKKVSQLFEDAEQTGLLEVGASEAAPKPGNLKDQQAALALAFARLTHLQRAYVLNYVQSLADEA